MERDLGNRGGVGRVFMPRGDHGPELGFFLKKPLLKKRLGGGKGKAH